MIDLKEIDRHNFDDIVNLRVAEHQRNFVATNAYSLSEAYACHECHPLAICNDDTPVGFVMYVMDADDGEWWIYRLMIDAKYQHQGFGRAAMNAVIDKIKADTEHHVLYISFEPTNEAAKALYISLGFVLDDGKHGEFNQKLLNGELGEDEEIIYRLDY